MVRTHPLVGADGRDDGLRGVAQQPDDVLHLAQVRVLVEVRDSRPVQRVERVVHLELHRHVLLAHLHGLAVRLVHEVHLVGLQLRVAVGERVQPDAPARHGGARSGTRSLRRSVTRSVRWPVGFFARSPRRLFRRRSSTLRWPTTGQALVRVRGPLESSPLLSSSLPRAAWLVGVHAAVTSDHLEVARRLSRASLLLGFSLLLAGRPQRLGSSMTPTTALPPLKNLSNVPCESKIEAPPVACQATEKLYAFREGFTWSLPVKFQVDSPLRRAQVITSYATSVSNLHEE